MRQASQRPAAVRPRLVGKVTYVTRRGRGRVAAKADHWSTDLREHKMYFLNNTYLKENDSPLEPVR